nr:uncharacterized protein LOC115254620 [Aedes albopictus]
MFENKNEISSEVISEQKIVRSVKTKVKPIGKTISQPTTIEKGIASKKRSKTGPFLFLFLCPESPSGAFSDSRQDDSKPPRVGAWDRLGQRSTPFCPVFEGQLAAAILESGHGHHVIGHHGHYPRVVRRDHRHPAIPPHRCFKPANPRTSTTSASRRRRSLPIRVRPRIRPAAGLDRQPAKPPTSRQSGPPSSPSANRRVSKSLLESAAEPTGRRYRSLPASVGHGCAVKFAGKPPGSQILSTIVGQAGRPSVQKLPPASRRVPRSVKPTDRRYRST